MLGAGGIARGTLTGEEPLAVAGDFEGRVQLGHHLDVVQGGRVRGEIHVASLAVAGTVEGNVVAQDWVQLLPGAAVKAELRAPRIIIEPGARFVGRIEMEVPLPTES